MSARHRSGWGPETQCRIERNIMKFQLSFEDGRQLSFDHPLPILIGRDPDCELVLKGWRVARQHARLTERQGKLWIEDLGSLIGTYVNGVRIGTHGPLSAEDEVIVGPCLIRLADRQGCPVPSQEQTPISIVDDAPIEHPRDAGAEQMPPISGSPRPTPPHSVEDQRLRRQLHEDLINALQLRRHDISGMSHEALREETLLILRQLLARKSYPGLPDSQACENLISELVDEAVGLGPLEPLLADPDITEIMVNRYDEIFVERHGRLYREAAAFSGEQAVLGIIERIVSPLGRRIDDSSPMVDARLRDGSRVNAVIGPIALRGASLTIRKFPSRKLTLQDLLKRETLSAAMAQFLTHCVRHRKNLVISGGTGTGKTSLLNILSQAIPENERVLTIEDAAELQLNHANLVTLEARPANIEGRGKVDIRDLVRNALRMRPDRIVVGECRGAEAFDMLAAMNTGHEGSMTTLHANSPRDALGRLETMILMAGMDLPLPAIREHIASSIDFLVQLTRMSDGRRLISAIVQVTGLEGGRIQLQDLFLAHGGPPVRFKGCGLMPEGFYDLALPDPNWFMADPQSGVLSDDRSLSSLGSA